MLPKGLTLFTISLTLIVGENPPAGIEINRGSTAICIAYPTVIYIGADSKLVGMNEKMNEMADAGKNCKVHSKDQFIYAAVGIPKSSNPDVDPIRIIDRIDLTNSPNLKDKITKIEKSIRDSMVSMAQSMKENQPKYFYSKELNKDFATFEFGMFENGRPVIGFLNIVCKLDNRGRIYFKDSISVNCTNPLILPIGHTDFFDSVKKSEGYLNQFHSVVEAIDAIVRGQSIKTRKDVNDIANIIYISAYGVISWAEKHQECE